MGLAVLLAFTSYVKTATHWRYSYIPDQIPFYGDAYNLAFKADYPSSWSFVSKAILNPRGVYGKHHRADNALKALFMRIFGPTVFGWRISSIFFGLAGAIALLLVVKKMTSSMYLACFGAVIMLFSPHYFAMSHYGYNNIHCIPFMLIPVLLTLSDPDMRKKRLWLFVGLARGLCFYTFKAGLIYMLWDLVFLLSGVLFRDRSVSFSHRARKGLECGSIYLAGLALCIVPTAMQSGFLATLFNIGKNEQRNLQRLLQLVFMELRLPVKYGVPGHGSQGAYWGIGGFLVIAGWLLSLIPGKILNLFGSFFSIPLWKYFLRVTAAVTLLAMVAIALLGHAYQTRAFVLIPLFILSAVLFITPFYRRWPRMVGWLCLMLLVWEGVRCLYTQQRSMSGVWQQSRIFCVAEKTEFPILYVTGSEKMAWWQDLYYGGRNWPVLYGFADRYRTAPTAVSLRPGEIRVEDNKPTGICDCDLYTTD